MPKNISCLCLCFLAAIFLSGCRKADDIRAMATSEIIITFNGQNCTPLESFIPAGETIQLTLENNSDEKLSWYFLIFPIQNESELSSSEHVYYSVSAAAQSTINTSFIAPQLTARYDTICIPNDDLQEKKMKYILVVQPYEKTPSTK